MLGLDRIGYDERDDSTVHIEATSQEQACSIISSAIHHLLFAKGQIHQPIKTLQKVRQPKKSEIEENSRPKAKSFNVQKTERRFEQFMSGIDRIHEQVVAAVNAVNHSSTQISSNHKDDVVLMLRLGQSPVTLAKQQFMIVIKGILSLPQTAIEADTKKNDVPLARRVFGGKKEESTSSLTRLPILERKLVRFLLSASMQESDLGKALTTPIAPTKTQLFIRAPKTQFVVSGWIPKSSIRIIENESKAEERMTKVKEDDERFEGNDLMEETAEEVDNLAMNLSPLKRKALMSPRLNGTLPKKLLFNKSPTSEKRDEMASQQPIEVKTDSKNTTAEEQMDAKRMARMQSRIQKRRSDEQNNQKLSKSIRKTKSRLNSRRTTCATLIIDLFPPGQIVKNLDETSKQDFAWYASDVILQACTI